MSVYQGTPEEAGACQTTRLTNRHSVAWPIEIRVRTHRTQSVGALMPEAMSVLRTMLANAAIFAGYLDPTFRWEFLWPSDRVHLR
jgi:hypothetical protein